MRIMEKILGADGIDGSSSKMDRHFRNMRDLSQNLVIGEASRETTRESRQGHVVPLTDEHLQEEDLSEARLLSDGRLQEGDLLEAILRKIRIKVKNQD